MAWILIIPVCMGILGLGLVGGGVAYYIIRKNKRSELQQANGNVVELVRELSNTSNAMYTYPVVEYTTADGDLIRFRSQYGTTPSPYKVGSKVIVRYDLKYPEQAEVESWLTVWLLPVILWVFGAFTLLFACVIGLIIIIAASSAG